MEYNTERTHSSLGNRTPLEFANDRRTQAEMDVFLAADSNASPD